MNYSPISIVEAIKKAKRVYVIGNGGSYANASHIANDFLSCGIKAYTLDAAFLTALANDYSYDGIYAIWLGIVGEPGDLLIALSGSGTSKNIICAIEKAKKIGMDVMLVTDYLKTLDMQESEEDQIRVCHEVMRLLRDLG